MGECYGLRARMAFLKFGLRLREGFSGLVLSEGDGGMVHDCDGWEMWFGKAEISGMMHVYGVLMRAGYEGMRLAATLARVYGVATSTK